MEIYLDRRSVKQIRLSAADAVEEGDHETLREDMTQAFTDEQVEEIERRIDNGDFYDFVSSLLDEWSGEDVEELFELMEAHLGEAGVDLKYASLEGEEEEEEEVEEDEVPSDDDDDELSIVTEDDEI